jgi:Phage-related minor tail protein
MAESSGIAVGRAVWQAALDRTQLKKDLDSSTADIKAAGAQGEQAASDSASRSVSRIGSVAKLGMSAVAGAAAGIFTVAAKGSVEMQDKMAQFQAATGASAEEARAWADEVNAMSGRNIQSLGEIADAATVVTTDLGLTGEAAASTTQEFLHFARATGQDAADAVLAFDDILDANNLTVDDAQGLMDQLVVSHQRFGGSIAANEAALAKMGPALQAMGAGVDEGIGLLNLFAASGIDAEAATKALNAAVKNMPPGTTIDDLVKNIGAIEDPAKRAQEAIRIFGAKAGVALANAIKPGTESLDEWIVRAEDVPGASTAAAAALDGTLGSQFQLLVNNAKAAITGLGMEFGPAGSLFVAVSSFGGLLAPALTKALAAIGVDKAVIAAATGSGTLIGSAIQLGIIAGLVGLGVLIIKTIGEQTTALTQPAEQGTWLERFHQAGDDAGAMYVDGVSVGLVRGMDRGLKGEFFEPILPAAEEAGTEIGDILAFGAAAGIEESGASVSASAGRMLGVIRSFAQPKAEDSGEDVGKAFDEGIKKGLQTDRKEVIAELADLGWAMHHQGKINAERERLIGQLHDQRLVDGLKSSDPLIRKQAQGIYDDIAGKLEALGPKAHKEGVNVSTTYADGISDGSSAVGRAVTRVAASVWRQLHVSSPAKEGPLSLDGGPGHWGVKAGAMYVEGWSDGLAPGIAGIQTQLGALAGSARIDASFGPSDGTVRHEFGGTVRVELSGSTIAAMRSQGASWDDIGRASQVVDVGSLLEAATRQAQLRFTSPRA